MSCVTLEWAVTAPCRPSETKMSFMATPYVYTRQLQASKSLYDTVG